MFAELHQLPRKENNKWRFDVRKRSVLVLKTTRAAGAHRRLRLLLKLSTRPHGRGTRRHSEVKNTEVRVAVYVRTPRGNAGERHSGKQLVSRRLKTALWRTLKDATAFILASSGSKGRCGLHVLQEAKTG